MNNHQDDANAANDSMRAPAPATSTDSPRRRLTPKQVAEANRISTVHRVLAESRESGDYPLTVEQLASRLAELPADTLKLLTGKGLKGEVLVVSKSPLSPVALRGDDQRLVDSDSLLKFAAAKVVAKRREKGQAPRGSVKQFVTDAGLGKQWSAALLAAIERRVERRALPGEVADVIVVVPSPAELAERLIQVLGSQRYASPSSYPVPQKKLFELAGCDGQTKNAKAAMEQAAFADRVIVCHSITAKEPAYILRHDLSEMSPTLATRGIEMLVAKSMQSGKPARGKSGPTNLFTAREVASGLIKDKIWQSPFVDSIEQGADQRTLGGELAWLRLKGTRCYFLRRDVEPQGPSLAIGTPAALQPHAADTSVPVGDFAAQFEAAFARVDSRNGARNFVKVLDLRQELAQVPRSQFDAGLRELRVADRFAMESAHGGAVRLTDEERQAGIQEGTSLLVYVSRK